MTHRGWLPPGRVVPFLGMAAVALCAAVAFTPLANVLSRLLAAAPRLEPAEAIVALAAGVDPDGTLSETSLRRALHGMVLHRRGLAPLLVLTGTVVDLGVDEAAIRADLAIALGAAPASILSVAGVRTTHEEAQRVEALLAPRGVRRILLVTGSQHMVRGTALFRRRGFEVLAAPIDAVGVEASSAAARFRLARAILQEGLARLYYRAAGYL